MDRLKLMALDAEDLSVVSAHLQDAVFKVGDISWKGQAGVLTLEVNRFVWEEGSKSRDRRKDWERRRAVLAVKRATAVKSRGFDRAKSDEVLSLLALRFPASGEEPAGTLELVLAGEASILLEVECIEVQLADVSGSWGTEFKPRHPLA
ncbi:MAG: hypothetical protein CML30_01525 [Rhizobiales bacterium]|nr:hypothetical protein [Hyphomicrobiales bacterium]